MKYQNHQIVVSDSNHSMWYDIPLYIKTVYEDKIHCDCNIERHSKMWLQKYQDFLSIDIIWKQLLYSY